MIKDEFDEIFVEFTAKCHSNYIQSLRDEKQEIINRLDELGSCMKDFIKDIRVKIPYGGCRQTLTVDIASDIRLKCLVRMDAIEKELADLEEK